MSVELAKEFFLLVYDSEDKTLLDELKQQDNTDQLLELAVSKGYQFTLEEYGIAVKQAFQEKFGEQPEEEDLTEDELESVAGGAAFIAIAPTATAPPAQPAYGVQWSQMGDSWSVTDSLDSL